MTQLELKAAAFFDLDRTLIAGASTFEFARAAYKAGLISRRQIIRDAYLNLKFRMRGSTDEETDFVKERVGNMIEGVRVRDMARLAPDILTGVLPRVYPRMLELAHSHQDAGRPAYICTAASFEIADLLAKILDLDGAIATRAEIVDGYYTGRYAGPFIYREGKAEAMRTFAELEGIDLKASYAYSDSESDLPMLDAVGNAVVVNPDGPLTKIAKERKWEIIRFEKLAQRLKLGGVIATVAAASGIGKVLMEREPHLPIKRLRLRQSELDKLIRRSSNSLKSLRPRKR